MRITHHDFVTEVLDEWLTEARMVGFDRQGNTSYRCSDPDALVVAISAIAPLPPGRRQRGVFLPKIAERQGEKGLTARERVLKILSEIRNGDPIYPIEVHLSQNEEFIYEQHHGVHRLHLSIAVGFSQIAVIEVPKLVNSKNCINANS